MTIMRLFFLIAIITMSLQFQVNAAQERPAKNSMVYTFFDPKNFTETERYVSEAFWKKPDNFFYGKKIVEWNEGDLAALKYKLAEQIDIEQQAQDNYLTANHLAHTPWGDADMNTRKAQYNKAIDAISRIRVWLDQLHSESAPFKEKQAAIQHTKELELKLQNTENQLKDKTAAEAQANETIAKLREELKRLKEKSEADMSEKEAQIKQMEDDRAESERKAAELQERTVKKHERELAKLNKEKQKVEKKLVDTQGKLQEKSDEKD